MEGLSCVTWDPGISTEILKKRGRRVREDRERDTMVEAVRVGDIMIDAEIEVM